MPKLTDDYYEGVEFPTDSDGNPMFWEGVDTLQLGHYQDKVEALIITHGEERLIENTLGLVGEAGEVAEKVKKYIRDGFIDTDGMIKELGDVLFYLVALSTYFGVEINEVADRNLNKLHDRKARGVIRGSGDDR